jgi:hypothetical protein
MNKKVNILYLFFLVLSFIAVTACKSIIEEDISDKKVIVNTPNGTSLTSYNQLFWWEKVDGALTYQIQIASPNLTNVQKLLLDTTIKGNKINFTLAAGTYEWHVRALNGSYQTAYSGFAFTITDAPLSTQKVILNTPATGTSVKTTVLTWNAIPIDGVAYQLKVSKSSAFTPEIINIETPLTTYNLSITDETTYYWEVRAYKGTDTSQWSSISSFIYDVTAPGKVVLTDPTNNPAALKPTTGNLTWVSAETGAKYYVFITYGTDAEKTFTANSTSYTYTAAQNQTVKWRVQAFDAAGNTGLSSDSWTFKTGTASSRMAE